MQPKDYQNDKCPICGGSSFSWGRIYGKDVKRLYWGADEKKKMFNFIFNFPTIKGRHCLTCDNITLFLEEKK